MKSSLLTELLLYRYRYFIGYALYALLLVILLTVGVTSLPRGLTESEMVSATASATATPQSILTQNALNAPYVVLQKASLSVLGITPLGIKLPSIVLALITGMVLALMLRKWFSVNVAVLTGIVVATSGIFLTMGRTGTAMILTAFWFSLILFAATKILHSTQNTAIWKLLFFMSVAFSLYTPMMIYGLIALAIAGLLHPHVRYTLRRMSIVKMLTALGLSIVIIAPLLWSIVQSPTLIFSLLGLPDSTPTLSSIWSNIQIFITVFFTFASVKIGEHVVPIFGAATLAIILLGLLKTIADRHSARSYMLLIWIGLLLPVILINPNAILMIFMPIVLLLAIGIETLIREWYRLFPRNPYARVAALIPLTILLGSITIGEVGRYFYGYMYAYDTKVFHQELTATHSTLTIAALQNKPVHLVVTDESQSFYDLLRRDYENVSVSSNLDKGRINIVSEERFTSLDSDQRRTLGTPYRLVTSGTANDGLVLRVYVPPQD